MATQDKCCSIVPYFKVNDGKIDAFQALCEQFVNKTKEEAKCLYYGTTQHSKQRRLYV